MWLIDGLRDGISRDIELMLLFFLVIVGLALFGCRVSFRGFREDYLDKDCTTAVNGVFILWVFLRHVQDYIGVDRIDRVWADKLFFAVDDFFGQRIVVLFLFFSGFGVMESLSKKGEAYLRAMPRSRILTTLLNFDIAVIFFMLADSLVGKSLGVGQIAFSFVAWDSVGNSDWYIFAILSCYAATFLAFYFKRLRPWGEWLTFIIVVGVALLLQCYKGSWWYNMILAYPFGVIFSRHRMKIEAELKKHYLFWIIVAVLVSCFFKRLPIHLGGIEKNSSSISFALLCVLMLMKVRVHNPVLEWLGAHLFPIYIYQRLPMMVLAFYAGSEWVRQNMYLFVVITFSLTLLIASGYRYWQVRLK